MTNAVNNMTVGQADAGLEARALFIARASARATALPTFRLLRS
ncbi:MAG TPA: hypothetical protein PKD53_05500 [Chloroflexaceae bacterium]|nr:hypothetical protein [Chloroflexaceae bacterium]